MLIRAALIAIVELFALGLLAFGVFLLAFGVRTIVADLRTWLTAWRSRSWSQTRGTILRSALTRHRTGRVVSFGARIRFAYVVAGQRHESKRHKFGSSLAPGGGALDELRRLVAQHRRGTDVTVWFDPARPESAVLDRRLPGLGVPFFLAIVALVGAGLFGALGVYVARGPLEEPPPFTDDELPSLQAQVGGLLLLVAGVALLAAFVCALRGLSRRDLLRRLTAAAPTRVADVQRDRVLAVFGRVEVSEAGTTPAPVTGDTVVYFKTTVTDRGETNVETTSHGDFYVADGSGRIRIVTEGGTDHLLPSATPGGDAAEAYADAALEDAPVPVPEDVALLRTCLAPGDPVLVVGRARRRDGELCMTADRDDALSLIFAGEPLVDLVRRLSRSAQRSRLFLGLALTAGLVGGMCLAFGG